MSNIVLLIVCLVIGMTLRRFARMSDNAQTVFAVMPIASLSTPETYVPIILVAIARFWSFLINPAD